LFLFFNHLGSVLPQNQKGHRYQTNKNEPLHNIVDDRTNVF
jgi:hypothetical protein